MFYKVKKIMIFFIRLFVLPRPGDFFSPTEKSSIFPSGTTTDNFIIIINSAFEKRKLKQIINIKIFNYQMMPSAFILYCHIVG